MELRWKAAVDKIAEHLLRLAAKAPITANGR
jgi:hypothetical protein